MQNPWKTLSSKIEYQNKFFKIKKDNVVRPNGEEGQYSLIEFAPSVMIVAITAEKEIYLIGQLRYTTNTWSWAVPGGSAGEEKLLDAAKRELQESAGLGSEEWEYLGVNRAMSGSTNKTYHIFLAHDVQNSTPMKQDKESLKRIDSVPFARALEMIQHGEITDCETISAITLAGLKTGML